MKRDSILSLPKSEYTHLLAKIRQGQFYFTHDLWQDLIESILTTDEYAFICRFRWRAR